MARITFEEAIDLYKFADILELGKRADEIRKEKHPDNIVTFVIDRNINYTNICTCRCKFCAFYKNKGEEGGYVISKEELAEKIKETKALGGNQVLLQGGLHPDLKLEFYEDMLSYMKSFDIWLHAFSAPEIAYFAKKSKLSIKDTLLRLMNAGLDSIPGGGAEILHDDVRKEISPNKIDTKTWLEVMEVAHSLGLKTTATMMFRKHELPEHIVSHLDELRRLQDRTGGFTAFIPWPFQPSNTELGGEKATALEYLRVLSLARIYLDNFPNIQVSWVTQGANVAQIGLLFGGNDFGSVMIEENVVKAAGIGFRMKTEEIKHTIRMAGFTPAIRNMQYDIIERG